MANRKSWQGRRSVKTCKDLTYVAALAPTTRDQAARRVFVKKPAREKSD
jgi:hypothetical protein